MRADLLVTHAAMLATPVAPGVGPPLLDRTPIRVIPDAAIAAERGRIVFIGTSAEAQEQVALGEGGERIDAPGMTILPGFVDAHTHLPFADDRLLDFERRLAGATYKEILAAGGGIHTTMRATREASEEALLALCLARLDRMLGHGTTTIEGKSGYGMDRDTELRQLRALRRAASVHPVEIVPTYMGAHVMPPEHARSREAYLSLVIDEMLPLVNTEGLAEAVDVFCEPSVYDLAETRRILDAARALGFRLHVHAEELEWLGGAELAAELGAASADHLVHVSPQGIASLARSGTAAVLLPATTFFLKGKRYAPARALIEAGAPVALATDCNPGSSMTYSMANVLALGCLLMDLTIAEALTATTLGGAYALGRHGSHGSLELGKVADLQILRVQDYRHVAYEWGESHVEAVVKAGRVVWRDGRRVASPE